jgi:hypothetical protein
MHRLPQALSMPTSLDDCAPLKDFLKWGLYPEAAFPHAIAPLFPRIELKK